MDYQDQSKLIKDFILALKALREGGVTTNKTDLTCQLSEWLVKEIFGGTLAPNSINKDWDVLANGRYIQVKAHAKNSSNPNKFTRIHYDESAVIDDLIIIVFSEDYVVREFYIVPWNEAIPLIKHNQGGSILSWSRIVGYKQDLDCLPNQEVIKLFRN